MTYTLIYLPRANAEYETLRTEAFAAERNRTARKQKKRSKAEGLFKQVNKALQFLRDNPKHPGLQSHEYLSLEHPFDKKQKVFEVYVQNNTPAAYRVFWCYGPDKGLITVIAITPHP